MTEKKPIVSIVVPVYNVESYLDKCLQSICNQTYSKIEIILVNDGSTDNSERIMEKWSEKDDRIIILHQENSGLSAARNKGLDKATGDWIVFVDSDDFISDNYVLKLLNSALINDADLVICQYDKIDQYNKIHQIIQSPSGMYNSTDFWSLFYSKSSGESLVVAWNKLYSKRILKEIRYKPGILNEDEQILYYIINESKSILIIPDSLYFYRIDRSNSITNNVKNNKSIRIDFYKILLERNLNFIKNSQFDFALLCSKDILQRLTSELSENTTEKNWNVFWKVFYKVKQYIKVIKKKDIQVDWHLWLYLNFPKIICKLKVYRKSIKYFIKE